jgi:hypothetical protein
VGSSHFLLRSEAARSFRCATSYQSAARSTSSDVFVVDVSDQFALAARAARDGTHHPSSASIVRAVMRLRFDGTPKSTAFTLTPLGRPF